MNPKKILVILGHPSLKSFNRAIADKYVKGAKETGKTVKTLYLPKLKFDPILHEGYNKVQKLEKDLVKAQNNIKWADHIVFVFPVWWGSMPALMKGFIDRVFLPGFAFKYKRVKKCKDCEKTKTIPEKLLKGKTGTLLMTTGGPGIAYFFFGKILVSPITITILNFTGIKLKKIKFFTSIRKISKDKADKILNYTYALGKKGI